MMTQKEYEESISKTHIRVRFVKLPDGLQIILIYANPENIWLNKNKLQQLIDGINNFPVPIDEEAVIVGNGEILGRVNGFYYLSNLF